MARNQAVVHVPTGTWTQLTGGDATKITWEIASAEEKLNGVWIRVTDNGTAPTEEYGIRFAGWTDPEINRVITDYRAGVAGSKRVWAKAIKEAVVVVVSDDSV
jgi:hypothetical protein